jgi:glycosyltransferase involved in cell wall biosynthesis
MRKSSFVFVSTMAGDSWGGSEELWSRTAAILAAEGHAVSASVREWRPLHPRVLALRGAGVDVSVRPLRLTAAERLWRRATFNRHGGIAAHVRKLLVAKMPSLLVISNGTALPPIELLELCASRRVPFVTIGLANQEGWWPEDDDARRYRAALPAADRCYFISKANLRLVEKQIGMRLPNAEIAWSPLNVPFHAAPAWPATDNGEIRFACVGRLHPPSKGQDILLEALANPVWAKRNWRLTIFGEGRMKDTLQRLVQVLGLSARVTFGGHAPIEDIWAAHHALVMPSRYEGLPLVMVEAMLCGRPVIATDVAGHSEIVEDGVTGFLADAPTVPSMARALERFWTRRAQAERMGKVAAEKIRERVPPDPARVFAEELERIAQNAR